MKFSENLSNFLIQNTQRFVIRQSQLQKHQLSYIIEQSYHTSNKLYTFSKFYQNYQNSSKFPNSKTLNDSPIPEMSIAVERSRRVAGFDTETSALRSLWHSLSFNVVNARMTEGLATRGIGAAVAAAEEEVEKREREREDREFKYRRH